LRRLGVGAGGGGGERPLRAQLVVALVAILILLAVPLYLWRRPGGGEKPVRDAGAESQKKMPAVIEAGAAVIGERDAGVGNERVRLTPPQRIKCGSSPKDSRQEGSLCDSLGFFEQALQKAIRSTVECAPKAKEEGTINFVLNVYFTNKNVHVFPGASGKWKGKQARRATECVKRALPTPPWDTITHQYRFYTIAIMATYPVPDPIPGPPGAPVFE
jgi:hypothetical protein